MRWSRLTPLLGITLFGAALWAIHAALGATHYRDIVGSIEAIPAWRILAAVGFTVLGFSALIANERLALRHVGAAVTWPQTAFTSFVGYAFSNTIGLAALTGASVRARLYGALGLSGVDIAEVVVLCGAAFWLGFVALAGPLFVSGLVVVPASWALSAIAIRVAGALLVAVLLAYWVAAARLKRPIVLFGHEVQFPGLGYASAQAALSAMDWTCAAAVLYVLLPETRGGGFLTFLGAFLLAQIAGYVSQVPAGLGVFESLVLLLLGDAHPAQTVVGALIAYRAIYYALPLVVAALLFGFRETVAQWPLLRSATRRATRLGSALAPSVFAAITLVAGALLLASGATPAETDRLHFLKDLIPLGLVELSHFLGSLTGAGLLILAWGLRRRIDLAYQLTCVLLAAGVVFSLVKGLDFEEAAVLAVLLVALLPARRHFYRHASLWGEPLSPGWIAGIVLVLAGAGWLTLFAHKHVQYQLHWGRFAFEADAPRSLRAIVGAVTLAALFGIVRLLRPTAPRTELPDAAEIDRAAAIVDRSGDASAHLALVGDKTLLFNAEGDGFVMYRTVGRSWIAMGDPVGPERARRELAWSFHELADRAGGWTCFYEVSARQLPLYLDLGLSLRKLGEEARVPLADFGLAGGARKSIRLAHGRAAREGATFEIVPRESVPALLAELRAISDEWLASKRTREKSFSLGAFDEEYLARLPVAVVRHAGRVVAFANLWAPREDREELSFDLMRHTQEGPPGVMDYLLCELMLWGRAQDYRWFNLGMAPLSGLPQHQRATTWSKLAGMVYRHGEEMYNFQGLRQFKEKFHPVWEPRYLACPGGLALPRILADLAVVTSSGLKGVLGK